MNRIASPLVISLTTFLTFAATTTAFLRGQNDPDSPGDANSSSNNLLFEFGAIADCQYCDADSKVRRYRLSPKKLRECVADFNSENLAHVVHLGDFIDRDWISYDKVLPIMQELKAPVRFVLGNHDFSVADEYKMQVPERLGLTDRYYDFKVGSWRFLILDSNDVSTYAYPEGSKEHRKSLEIHEALGGDLPRYNGGIGKEQLAWIEEQLIKAEANGETVILHAHHPVYPFSRGHNVWNDAEVVELLEKHSCVAAYINGHNHAGNYAVKNGIHYLTLKGMVDTEENAYCVVRVFPDRIEIRGRGRQENFDLEIPGATQ